MNFSSEEKTNKSTKIFKKFLLPIIIGIGIIFYYAEKDENKIEDNNQSQEENIAQDQVYNYTNNLIAQLNPTPTCVMLAQQMRNIASSQAPDNIRVRQVDKIFDRMPNSCIRQ